MKLSRWIRNLFRKRDVMKVLITAEDGPLRIYIDGELVDEIRDWQKMGKFFPDEDDQPSELIH